MSEDKRIDRQNQGEVKQYSDCLFNSNLIQTQQVNQDLYYFHFCMAKADKRVDYQQGYLIIVHQINNVSTTLFFLKQKKAQVFSAQKLKRVYEKEVNLKTITKSILKEKRLIFNYKINADQNISELQIKFEYQNVASEWKRLIIFYQPSLESIAKDKKHNKMTQQVYQQKILSTKESLNQAQQIQIIKGEKIYCTTSKQPVHKYQQEIESRLHLQSKIKELEQLLKTQRLKIQVCLKQNEVFRKNSIESDCNKRRERQLEETISKLQEKLSSYEKQITQLLIDKNRQIEDIQPNRINQFHRLLIQKQKLTVRVEELEVKINMSKQQESKTQSELYQMKETVKAGMRQVDKYSKDAITIKKINQNLFSTKELLSKRIKEFQKQDFTRQELIQKVANYQKKLEQTKVQQKFGQKQMQIQQRLKKQYDERIAEITNNYDQCLIQSKQLKNRCEKQKKDIQALTVYYLFNGDLLEDYVCYKELLKTEIEAFTHRKIYRTKLIYKFDPINKVNFHRYIDGYMNILLIVRTSSGHFLAGFSESALLLQSPASDGGLIISLTNRKSFRCLEKKKSVTYDDYYIIFGNSELRIKSSQSKIFSNFGIANGFYASNGCKVDALFGENSREVELQNYQIYQVHLH